MFTVMLHLQWAIYPFINININITLTYNTVRYHKSSVIFITGKKPRGRKLNRLIYFSDPWVFLLGIDFPWFMLITSKGMHKKIHKPEKNMKISLGMYFFGHKTMKIDYFHYLGQKCGILQKKKSQKS